MDCPILYDVLYNANIIILMGMTIFCTRRGICSLGKCRSYGAQSAFICVYPGFHIGLCPHSTLGYAGVSPFQGSLQAFICVYPGFHIGLCPHSTLGYAGVSPLQGSLHAFSVFPGFHIGLCPHSTLGYAGVSCLKALIMRLNFDALALGSYYNWSIRLERYVFV